MNEKYKPDYSPEGYKNFLEMIKENGYKFVFFGHTENNDNKVFLRHDVDKSPQMALEMAKIEKDMNIKSTYLFLLHSPLYNLTEEPTKTNVSRIKELGHRIGLHCDERFLRLNNKKSNFESRVLYEIELLEKILEIPVRKVVSFHNPSDYVKDRKFKKFINTYAPEYFLEGAKYISDSNRNWREKDFHKYLKDKRFNALQILIHPLWWMDKEEEPEKVLKNIYETRIQEVDMYLKKSNDLWAKK